MNKRKKKKKQLKDAGYLEAIKLTRGSWNGLSPVTKIIPNKKHYNRKRDKNGNKNELDY